MRVPKVDECPNVIRTFQASWYKWCALASMSQYCIGIHHHGSLIVSSKNKLGFKSVISKSFLSFFVWSKVKYLEDIFIGNFQVINPSEPCWNCILFYNHGGFFRLNDFLGFIIPIELSYIINNVQVKLSQESLWRVWLIFY